MTDIQVGKRKKWKKVVFIFWRPSWPTSRRERQTQAERGAEAGRAEQSSEPGRRVVRATSAPALFAAAMLRRNDGRCLLALAVFACSCGAAAAAAAAGAARGAPRPAVGLRRAGAAGRASGPECTGPLADARCLRLKGGGRLSMRERSEGDQAMKDAEDEALKATLSKVISKNRPIAAKSNRCDSTGACRISRSYMLGLAGLASMVFVCLL